MDKQVYKRGVVAKGFTLLETMITMFIVAVGLLAMAQMLITTMKQNLNTEIRMDAVVMVQSMLEAGTTYITSDASCVNLATNVNVNKTQTYQGGTYTFVVTCTVLTAGSQYLVTSKVQDASNKVIADNRLVYTSLGPETPGRK